MQQVTSLLCFRNKQRHDGIAEVEPDSEQMRRFLELERVAKIAEQPLILHRASVRCFNALNIDNIQKISDPAKKIKLLS